MSFCSKLNNDNKNNFILQMITVFYFLTLQTKLRIKINALQNMSSVLMSHGPIKLVCKFIIFNVYLSNNEIYDCK